MQVVAEIVGGVDGDARPGRSRAAETSTLVMRAVRVVAAHERHVQHARQLHIVHEERAAGEQPRVLVADGRAR